MEESSQIKVRRARRHGTYINAIFRPAESTMDFGQGLKARQSVTAVEITENAVTFTERRSNERSTWERTS